jgi:hypothetical protein
MAQPEQSNSSPLAGSLAALHLPSAWPPVPSSSTLSWWRSGINPILKLLLLGTHSPRSQLQKFRGQTNTLLRQIWLLVLDYWSAHVVWGATSPRCNQPDTAKFYASVVVDKLQPADQVRWDDPCYQGMTRSLALLRASERSSPSPLVFPKPKGLNINMMPFVLGDKQSLPADCHAYWPIIRRCLVADWTAATDSIAYLTIQESKVKKGKSQRRPGLHVEAPITVSKSSSNQSERKVEQEAAVDQSVFGRSFPAVLEYWGRGIMEDNAPAGGLFMCSNVDHSCRVWDAAIRAPESVIGPLGSIEHLRSYLGPGRELRAGELVWLTDLTPHESLPVKQSCYRQFFRLVTGEVSVWYSQHSTPNPLGIKPPQNVRIIDQDKFEGIQDENATADWNSDTERSRPPRGLCHSLSCFSSTQSD